MNGDTERFRNLSKVILSPFLRVFYMPGTSVMLKQCAVSTLQIFNSSLTVILRSISMRELGLVLREHKVPRRRITGWGAAMQVAPVYPALASLSSCCFHLSGPQDTVVPVLKGEVQIQIQIRSRKTPLSHREKEYRSPESDRNSRILTLLLNGGLTLEVF